MEEIHPNWYRDVPNMETLVLGSFPPHSSKWTYPFYYPNQQNRFWEILARLSNATLHHYPKMDIRFVEERFQIMRQLKIGVQNIGYKIYRKGTSSLDANIAILEYHDILSIIRQHHTLQRILLPGYSAPSSTYRAFIRYLQLYGMNVEPVKHPKPLQTSFCLSLDEKDVKCIVLNSTSRACAIPFDSLLAQFSHALFEK
jgi:G:T/U-mismatch repair DNA glycosylase